VRASIPRPAARSSIRRRPRCTCPSRRPSSVWGRAQLARPAEVVQDRGRKQDVAVQPRVNLGRLAAQGGHGDRVLEEAARVVVVLSGRGGKGAKPLAERPLLQEPGDDPFELRVRDLAGEELEEAVELVGVAPEARRKAGGIRARRGLERADVELQPVAVALDPPEHAHGVAFGETTVEQLDVVPDARVDASAGVDELEDEVRRPGARAEPLLARDGVHALDDAVLGQLGDRGHEPRV
jgi:hypothetical protein